MMRSKRRLGALALCAVAIGVVVFGVGGVQAEKTANWKVEKNNLTAGLSPTVEIMKVETGGISLSTKVGGISTEFLCSGAAFIGAKLETEGRVSSGNKTKFTGCITKLNGKVSAACEPLNGGTEKGVAVSTALKGLLVLHEGKGIIRFEPVTGSTFLLLEFSEECSIGTNCPVIGVQTVKDSNGSLGEELVTHTVEQGPLSELWVVSKTAEHVATVAGKAVLGLGGAHTGLKWSGVPG